MFGALKVYIKSDIFIIWWSNQCQALLRIISFYSFLKQYCDRFLLVPGLNLNNAFK